MRILIVEDDGALRERLARALRDRGHAALTAATGAAARALAVDGLDGAVVDIRLEGESGLDVARGLVAAWPGVRIILMTGQPSAAVASDAATLGVTALLSKPLDADDLLAAFDTGTAAS